MIPEMKQVLSKNSNVFFKQVFSNLFRSILNSSFDKQKREKRRKLVMRLLFKSHNNLTYRSINQTDLDLQINQHTAALWQSANVCNQFETVSEFTLI